MHRREHELMWTQDQVRAAGGPSTATQRHIEGAKKTSYAASTLQHLERGLKWKQGSVRAILAGGHASVWEEEERTWRPPVEPVEGGLSLEEVRRWAQTYRHLSRSARRFLLDTLDEAEESERLEHRAGRDAHGSPAKVSLPGGPVGSD